ncbi:hypothetical protein [Paraburkholderia sp. LEh10]|uniref:hypothetical protein n=1 Tax=Paraburkholderia sp. LEh10 TaxID=2821353 RepID=UPI001FD7659C|nr:hypothetical protein [Paraburkholderia sp. LEh10]
MARPADGQQDCRLQTRLADRDEHALSEAIADFSTARRERRRQRSTFLRRSGAAEVDRAARLADEATSSIWPIA